MSSTMIPERSSSTVPHYCPHWPKCDWSFVGSETRAAGFLATHIRVVHKGVDPRPPAEAPGPPRPRPRRQPSPGAAAAPAASRRAEATSEPELAPRADGRARCRTEGCEHPANARYDRGVYVGLCEEACIPARRETFSRQISAGKQTSREVKRGREPGFHRISAASPEPPVEAVADAIEAVAAIVAEASEPATSSDPGAKVEGRVADEPLLALIRQAARGRRELLEAEQRYLEQLRILRRHPEYERVAPILHDAVERL